MLLIKTDQPNTFWNPNSNEILELKPLAMDCAGNKKYQIEEANNAPKIWEACETESIVPVENSYQYDGLYPHIKTYLHRETGARFQTQIYL